MTYEAKVTRQFQTTIPKAISEKYGIDEGDSIIYVDLGDHVAIVPRPRQRQAYLAGSARLPRNRTTRRPLRPMSTKLKCKQQVLRLHRNNKRIYERI